MSTTIERPVGEVWARLVDLDTAHHWMTGVTRVEIIDGEGDPIADPPPLAAGTRYRFYARGGTVLGRVDAFEPQALLTLAADHAGVSAIYSYSVSALDDASTRVELHARCEAPGFWRHFHPVLNFLMRRSDGDQLEDFRRHVERA